MGGLIKLSAATINQMNIQDAASPPSNSPALPRQGKMDHCRKVARWPQKPLAPSLPRVRHSEHPELLFLPRNSGICREQELIADPRPRQVPREVPVTAQSTSVRHRYQPQGEEVSLRSRPRAFHQVPRECPTPPSQVVLGFHVLNSGLSWGWDLRASSTPPPLPPPPPPLQLPSYSAPSMWPH